VRGWAGRGQAGRRRGLVCVAERRLMVQPRALLGVLAGQPVTGGRRRNPHTGKNLRTLCCNGKVLFRQLFCIFMEIINVIAYLWK